jgi:hypothetical protein
MIQPDYANLKMLREVEDVTPEIERDIANAVEWFDDSPTMGTQEFIDRLCKTYGGEDYDLDSYDNPAARKIMRVARQVRAEARA